MVKYAKNTQRGLRNQWHDSGDERFDKLSTNDGWILEYAQDRINSFIIPMVDPKLPIHEQDRIDAQHLYEILEKEILPRYYGRPDEWSEMVKKS